MYIVQYYIYLKMDGSSRTVLLENIIELEGGAGKRRPGNRIIQTQPPKTAHPPTKKNKHKMLEPGLQV